MEFNSDLTDIQGLLRGVVRTTGDFIKIKYKGGNEMKINNIIKDLEDVLVSKNYIDKRTPNKDHDKELDNIVFFLVLNLDFNDKSLVDIKEYTHLISTIPTLSKCLLANIIVELGLSEYYCNALHKLPLEFSEELLSEIIPCIKKSKAETCLELVYLYSKNIIKKVSSVKASNSKIIEYIDKVEGIHSQILLNYSGITPESVEGWKRLRIYEHMGYTLLYLLKLLEDCQVDNDILFKIIDDLINTVCCVMNAVTVDVFCAWAELQHSNETLQIVIAEKSYHTIEKYKKYEPAKPLIQMLSSIAKKPKTLNELIHEASITTMVTKIDENVEHRNKWFTALLNTQVFQNKEAKDCVKRWTNLCTIEDLERLLSLSVNHKDDEEVVDIIIKCTSFFDEKNLAVLMTRFFYQYGLKNCLKSKNTQPQLIITLNKLEKNSNKEFVKDILLLLLQDPELVLTALLKAVAKSDVLLDSLEDTLKLIAHIMVIENVFSRILKGLLEETKIDSRNVKNYERIFKIIAEASQLKLERFFLIPLMNEYLTDERYSELSYIFQIHSSIPNKLPDDVNQLIEISIKILEKCRWKMFDFTTSKAALCEEAVKVLLSCKNIHCFPITDEYISSLQHVLNKYYLFQLRLNETDVDFVEYVCPHLQLENHTESVAYLIKLLPICIESEWYTVVKTLLKKSSNKEVIAVLTDSLMIITQVVQTQLEKDNNCVLAGLRYCIQNYGLIAKNVMLPLGDEETNISVVKSICRLLREMPEELSNTEGMSLMSLLPDHTLKTLKEDENLISILLSMNGSQVSRIIAKKMLE
ncbi:hypothetical protein Trydic_g6898 [Trypoxylus dichotomus]